MCILKRRSLSVNELLPREKAISNGIESLSDIELLALILKSAYKDKNVFELSKEIINKANGFHNLPAMKYEELTSIKGIKKAKALEIMAILEISKRLNQIEYIKKKDLDNPKDVVKWLRVNLSFSDEEEFFVVYMNARGRIICSNKMYKGNRNASIVGIDAILRKAILLKASYFIVAHNHPSDKIEPSRNDIELTSKLLSASNMVGIPLLDHIIIGKSDYFSFKNNSMLE